MYSSIKRVEIGILIKFQCLNLLSFILNHVFTGNESVTAYYEDTCINLCDILSQFFFFFFTRNVTDCARANRFIIIIASFIILSWKIGKKDSAVCLVSSLFSKWAILACLFTEI